jgi:hypothetical protein
LKGGEGKGSFLYGHEKPILRSDKKGLDRYDYKSLIARNYEKTLELLVKELLITWNLVIIKMKEEALLGQDLLPGRCSSGFVG